MTPGDRVQILDVLPPQWEGHASWHSHRDALAGQECTIARRPEPSIHDPLFVFVGLRLDVALPTKDELGRDVIEPIGHFRIRPAARP